LIIILAARVVSQHHEKIGDPRNAQEQVAPPGASSSTAAVPAPQQQGYQKQAATSATAKSNRPVYPIEGLSPYQNNWTIKARVTSKGAIRPYANARGEGKLFNITLMDDTGEIRGTAFNQAVDELYDKLEEGKVYFISKARVNLAKKKFSNLTNDYELGLERSTEVEEVSQDLSSSCSLSFSNTRSALKRPMSLWPGTILCLWLGYTILRRTRCVVCLTISPAAHIFSFRNLVRCHSYRQRGRVAGGDHHQAEQQAAQEA
jgi:hypothetical protein